MDTEISARALQKLIGIRKSVLAELVEKGVVVRGKGRDRYLVLPSVPNYCTCLREQASARGGEAGPSARERLGQAQAMLAEARAAQLRGELVEVVEVEAKWTVACRAVRSRVLAVADRMRDLPARQHVKLEQELRLALGELSQGEMK
jgi:phage terminase Nu1 subunit (DNA packaging protein)